MGYPPNFHYFLDPIYSLPMRSFFRILHPVELYLALDRKLRRGCERKERIIPAPSLSAFFAKRQIPAQAQSWTRVDLPQASPQSRMAFNTDPSAFPFLVRR